MIKKVDSLKRIEAHQLPKRLREKFDLLRARLWRVELAISLMGILLSILASFLLSFSLDRWHDTSSSIRSLLVLASLAGGGLSAAWWCWRWILAPRGLGDYSRLVQRKYRILGDRLLGVVELSNEEASSTGHSEELYRAAVDQVEWDVRSFAFDRAVPTLGLHRLGLLSCLLAFITLALGVVFPGASRNAWARWLQPQAAIERYTLVQLDLEKETYLMIRGEPFAVGAKVSYASFWQPTQVTAVLDSGYQVEGEVVNGSINLEIPGQFKETSLSLLLGDTSATAPIKPILRPALSRLNAEVAMPAYLGLPKTSADLQSGSLNLLEGSKILITGQVTRELESVQIQWGDSKSPSVKIEGDRFNTPWLDTDNVYSATLEWQDHLGFRQARPWQLSIRQQNDQAPTIQFPDLFREMAILETEALELKTRVADDYGVQDFGVLWKSLNGIEPSEETLRLDFSDTSLHRAQKELSVSFYFSPNLYGIAPGDVVELFGQVTDYYPEREPSLTPLYRIHIVSSVEHAERIRQQLESLMTEIEDVSRLEQSIADATRETLDNLSALSPEDIARRTEDQASDQELNASHLAELAQRGMETLREAMRNPAFSNEMMSEWTQTLSEMEQLADQTMQEAAQALQEAASPAEGQKGSPAQPSPSSPQSPQSASSPQQQALQEAQEKEQQVLEALQDLQAMVNEGLDELQAMTLAQRLRGLSQTELELESTLMDGAEQTLGLFNDELPPRWRALHEKLGETQEETAGKTGELQEEIGRFFERTQQDPYGEVSDAMIASQAVEGLNATRSMILKNITMDAADQIASWAEQFAAWATLLEPEEEEGEAAGGGEGEGGGQKEQDLTEQLMALLRMRESELNLRMRTRLLDRPSQKDDSKVTATGDLSTQQYQLQESLQEIQDAIPLPFMDPVFEEIRGHMGNAADGLARGNTGKDVVEAETQSINTLTDAINLLNEQAQKNDPSSSASQSMSFMMQMMMASQSMGQQPNSQQDGGNTSGGDTNRQPGETSGNDQGDAPESRTVSKGSGQAFNLPAEFRQSFELYFQQLEQLPSPQNTVSGATP